MVNTSIRLGVALATLFNVAVVTATENPRSLDTKGGTATDMGFLGILEEENNFDHGSSITEKNNCPSSKQCTKAGGSCIKTKAVCDGITDHKGCKGKKCKCCIPACGHQWTHIDGAGSKCYLFSQDIGEGPRTNSAARDFCQRYGDGGGDLATAGHLSATDADPLCDYVKKNSLDNTWVGAYKSSSVWQWIDRRVLSVQSNLWVPTGGQPSGDGDCVEIINQPWGKDYKTAFLNDLSCSGVREFVCEK